MAINVSINMKDINDMPNRVKAGRKAAASQAQSEMEKYVPYKEGDLRDDSYVTDDGRTIRYTQPYAHAQFIGLIDNQYPIHNYSTPGTGKRWDLRLKGNKSKMRHVKKALINGAKLYGPNR
ncbi:minor capsid protein [Companilactobacillus futsaii]|nr:minor capsid protein [Companilactobacillus futsaii]